MCGDDLSLYQNDNPAAFCVLLDGRATIHVGVGLSSSYCEVVGHFLISVLGRFRGQDEGQQQRKAVERPAVVVAAFLCVAAGDGGKREPC